ncbi:hypothetical protein M1D30_07540 [Prevotella sp. E15-22]|uniref:hypothetical protein n=1 Tax=Prevotella sp. E15-22 TaxID=2937774 RepID=UPI002047D571|nr:hypothetical protein [Prevotella sp. E15-22]UPS43458.1 hypothetical protein M1D30_07540 [Prevotella sp. E15-22]
MSNPAFMSVCLVGDRRQLRSLYGKMLRLQNRREPLVEAVYAAIDAFDEENDDMDAYINLKEFEVVGLNELC